MFTIDEQGNTVFHLTIGRGGYELLTSLGFKNTMTPEEYKEHMASHNRRVQKENDKFMEQIKKWFNV